MAGRILVFFALTLSIGVLILSLQSYSGKYSIYYIPATERFISQAPITADQFHHTWNSYYFRSDQFNYDTYSAQIEKQGTPINKLLKGGEKLEVLITDKSSHRSIYLGELTTLDSKETCFLLLRNQQKALCRSDLMDELNIPLEKIDYERYYELLSRDGKPIDTIPFGLNGYKEFIIAEKKFKNDSLIISRLYYNKPDYNENCLYRVWDDEKSLCSVDLHQQIKTEVTQLLAKKYLEKWRVNYAF